jgi:hypothetical protein
MPDKIITVEIKVAADTPVRAKDKEKLLNTISNLPKEQQQLLIELGTNPKMMATLVEYAPMLRNQFS